MLVSVKLEPPLGAADSVVAPALMISIPHTLLQQVSSFVLTLYLGTFLGQTFCVLHASHVGPGMDSSAVHAPSSMATHVSPSTPVQVLSSMAAHSPSHHGEHSGPIAPDHTSMCAAIACASALTATPDHDLEPMNRVSPAHVAYLAQRIPPDAEMVPPPPRLG